MIPVLMVDMKKSEEQIARELDPTPEPNPEYVNEYPYGLCICLDNDMIEKLGLDDDVEAGDGIQFVAYAKVTSSSSNDTAAGTKRRVEIQITHMGLGPDHYEEEKD